MIQYVSWLVAMPFIFRFHLEQTPINPYHRSIRFLIQITDPFVVMLRVLVRVKWFNTIAPLLIAFLLVLLINFSYYVLFLNQSMKLAVIISIVYFVQAWARLITYALVIYVICSWVRIPQLATLSYILHHFLQPIVGPIQRVLPSFGGLDFSPIIVFFGLYYFERLFAVFLINNFLL